jgi:hypothetical protein
MISGTQIAQINPDQKRRLDEEDFSLIILKTAVRATGRVGA